MDTTSRGGRGGGPASTHLLSHFLQLSQAVNSTTTDNVEQYLQLSQAVNSTPTDSGMEQSRSTTTEVIEEEEEVGTYRTYLSALIFFRYR